MKQISLLLFLFLPFLFLEQASGQISQSELDAAVHAGIDPYFVETSDTVSEYGPRTIVRDVLQDKKGNYWFTTWQGIMGYDGKVFTNYTLKYNLKHFHVFSVFEDSKGNIWFGTVRGGLYKYNSISFTLFTTKNGLADNTIMCMAEDKEGNIWFGTENGASRFDGKEFINFTTREGLSSNYINSILCDKTGKMWFGTSEGINRYDARLPDGQGKYFTRLTDKNSEPFQQVASLLEDQDGKIWIGSGKGKGLCFYDGKSVSDYLIPNFVMYMCQDKKGNLWLAHNTWPLSTNFILYRYNGKTFTEVIEQTTPPGNPAIFGITEDKSGNIWYGTVKGVCRFNPSGQNAPTYFTE